MSRASASPPTEPSEPSEPGEFSPRQRSRGDGDTVEDSGRGTGRGSAAVPLPPAVESPYLTDEGVTPGVNVRPGSADDGWVVPPPVTLTDGTRIQLYKDGEALDAAYHAIKAAKKRVCLEVYIFAGDATGRAFADLLAAKARQGLKVYLIYDDFGSLATPRAQFERLRRAGVHVRVFHPLRPWACDYSWRPINRDHRKLLVIDDDVAGLGGLNIGAEYAGSWVSRTLQKTRAMARHARLGLPLSRAKHAEPEAREGDTGEFWRDNAIGVVGPSARVLGRAFARTWRYLGGGGRLGRAMTLYPQAPRSVSGWERGAEAQSGVAGKEFGVGREGPEGPEGGTVARGVPGGMGGWGGRGARGGRGGRGFFVPREGERLSLMATVPTVDSPLRPVLHKLFASARSGLLMTMAYFAPDDDLIGALCRAAKRGVRVRLMLPGRCDVPILVTAARSFYDRLMSAGVEIYERQGVVLHAKTMVIDRQVCVIGSTNLDYRSIEYNLEISAIITSPALGEQMTALFENDVRYARRIDPATWPHRPTIDRMKQWAVSRARYVL